MVQDFVIADSLHLLELGVMKRCLIGWRDGSLGYSGKLSGNQIEMLSKDIQNVKLPSEIHRVMRGLDCLAHWKGVEWHNLLNYVGIVVFKDLLPEKIYTHFLLLFIAVTICSCDVYSKHRQTAQLMFEKYIEEYKDIYGSEYITSNIHNLQHVVNDVNRFGCLQSISSYPFENCLFQIKNLLRQGNNNLQQVANRIQEKNVAQQLPVQQNKEEKKYPCVMKVRSTVQCKIDAHFTLSNVFHDSWFLSNDNEIVRVVNVEYTKNGSIVIHGKSVKYKKDFFVIPVRSSLFYIYLGNINCMNNLKTYQMQNIFCKLVAIRYYDQVVFIPLQHTLRQ